MESLFVQKIAIKFISLFIIIFNHQFVNSNFSSDVSLYINFYYLMIKVYFATVLLLCILFSAYTQAVGFPTFEQYISNRKKSYSTSEFNTRKQVYTKRLAEFAAITKYTPGVNNFTDWYADEINKLKNLKTLNSLPGKTPPSINSNVNPTLTWKGNKKITPVKNQGMCGSSWAFAATAYAQSKLLIDKRQSVLDLAQQKLLQCTKQSSCSSGYIQYAMQSVVDGIPTQGLYNYDPSYKYPLICSVLSMSPGSSVENYYKLNDSQLITLLQQRPLVISVSANGWENYKQGIFQCQSGDPVNFAALLVGYDTRSWYVKNSWGADWGQEGFIRISRTPGLNCGIGASAHRTFEWQLFSTILLVFLICLSLI